MKPAPIYRNLLATVAVLLPVCAALAKDQRTKTPEAPAILGTMQSELDRSLATYSKADPAAYFISYTVADRQYSEVSGSNGALLSSTDNRARWLEVQTRVGTYQLDDTHKLG